MKDEVTCYMCKKENIGPYYTKRVRIVVCHNCEEEFEEALGRFILRELRKEMG